MAACAVLLAEPIYAGCGRPQSSCVCGHTFSVYPADPGVGRRLPGQWWDDGGSYISAPAANHAYGFVDNSDKPWSLIPGDGYVGASVPKVSKDDEDDEDYDENDDEDTYEDDTDAPSEDLDPPLPETFDDSDTDMMDKDKQPATRSDADGDLERELDSLLEPQRDDAPRGPSNRPEPVETDASFEPLNSLSVPPTPASAGYEVSLLALALVSLALAGHYARRSWNRNADEVPVMTI
jgi:hypothetical protein